MNLVKLLSDMIPAESKKELVSGITSWLNSYSEMQQTVQDVKASQSEILSLLQELQTRFDVETHYNDVDSTLAEKPEPAKENDVDSTLAEEPEPAKETETG